jgi:hypothetical protein
MNRLLVEIQNVHNDNTKIFSVNPDLELLTPYEKIAEMGQVAIFLKNNLFECIEVFGVKTTSELIEESQNGFSYLISNNMPEFKKKALQEKPNINVPNSEKSHYNTIWDTIKDHSKEIGWTVLAAIALAGAYKIYKNYFSKAARACKGKSGSEKEACMTNYQHQAYKLKQQSLKKSLKLANRSNDATKYKKKINDEIQKINQKLK